MRSKTSSNLFILDERTPFEAVTGDTPNISSLMDNDCYKPICYFDEVSQFKEPKRHIGQWLGQAHNIGQAMCYWILPASGIPIACSSVTAISFEEHMQDAVHQELCSFDEKIQSKFNALSQEKEDTLPDFFDVSVDDSNVDQTTPEFEPIEEPTPDADEWDHDAYVC